MAKLKGKINFRAEPISFHDQVTFYFNISDLSGGNIKVKTADAKVVWEKNIDSRQQSVIWKVNGISSAKYFAFLNTNELIPIPIAISKL